MILSISLVIFAVAGCAENGNDQHQLIKLELIQLVENNSEIRSLLTTFIAEAKKVNPDPKTNPAQSLSDYYGFIDRPGQNVES